MNHLTNRRRSDGTPLDVRHGISGLCDGSSWRCITKCDTLSWFDHTRFRTTVRVSKQEQVMFESSSKNRKSWNGWQLIWQWVPDIWSNRWKWFGGCNGGFTWGNTDWQSWRRAECSRRYILWDERCKIGWLLKLEHSESNRSDFKANSVANRKPMQIRKNRCDVAEPRFLCDHSSKSILDTFKIALMALVGAAPEYLMELCRPVGSAVGRQCLQSAARGDLVVPRFRLPTFGHQAFAISGPQIWNSLPLKIRQYRENLLLYYYRFPPLKYDYLFICFSLHYTILNNDSKFVKSNNKNTFQ